MVELGLSHKKLLTFWKSSSSLSIQTGQRTTPGFFAKSLPQFGQFRRSKLILNFLLKKEVNPGVFLTSKFIISVFSIISNCILSLIRLSLPVPFSRLHYKLPAVFRPSSQWKAPPPFLGHFSSSHYKEFH